MAQPENETWNATQLGDMIGVGERHVKRLAADGVIPKVSRGRYGPDAIAAYCDFLRTTAGQGGADFAQERARLTKARADVEEMNLAARRGELLERADVDAAVVGAFTRVRAKMLSIPSKTAPLVAMSADPATCETMLRQGVNDALQELAETDVASI